MLELCALQFPPYSMSARMRWISLLAALLLALPGCALFRAVPPAPALLPTLTPGVSLPVIAELPKPTLTAEVFIAALPPVIYQPVFEPAACAFPIPAGTSPGCGYLTVPENRSRPNGQTIRLHVGIFRNHAGLRMPEAVVHLAGGPGSSSLASAGYLFSYGMGAVLEHEDLILFDQRGTGYSQPRLDCPEREELAPVLLEGNLPVDGNEQLTLDAFRGCRDRLLSQGIDLSAYNSAASAADLNDLRIALGYEKLDLYAVSYGTRLALTLMRDHPDAARSTVLDSTYPLAVNLYTALAANAQRAFDVFFANCAADPACNTPYPDLQNVFYQLVDRLNASPVEVPIREGGMERAVRLDGGLLVDVLFTGLYNPSVTASMPRMIYEIRSEQYETLRNRLRLYFERSSALGMQMSVQCNEELPFDTMNTAYAAAQGVRPEIAGYYLPSIEPLFEACKDWSGGSPDPRENLPVRSDIPALVLAGQGDPITPPEWGRRVASELSHAYYHEFAGNGHWVTRSSPCALQMALAFWRDPEIDPTAECK
jgi:pimeloyl-ACP methyl ester carboxylesterase